MIAEKENPLIFIVGGARSGKSSYAETLVQSFPAPRIYLATAEITDQEMEERIEIHKQRRVGFFDATIEEPLHIASVLHNLHKKETVLIDCLSLFLGNLFYYEGEKDSYSQLDDFYAALEDRSGPIIIVSNEVGEGIVPDNKLSRLYRDQSGWMNQKVASLADVVIKMCCGIPQVIKGNLP